MAHVIEDFDFDVYAADDDISNLYGFDSMPAPVPASPVPAPVPASPVSAPPVPAPYFETEVTDSDIEHILAFIETQEVVETMAMALAIVPDAMALPPDPFNAWMRDFTNDPDFIPRVPDIFNAWTNDPDFISQYDTLADDCERARQVSVTSLVSTEDNDPHRGTKRPRCTSAPDGSRAPRVVRPRVMSDLALAVPSASDLAVFGTPGLAPACLWNDIPMMQIGCVNVDDPRASRGFLPNMLALLHPLALRETREYENEVDNAVSWEEYLRGTRIMIESDNGKLTLWMGEHGPHLKKRWCFTAAIGSAHGVPDRVSPSGKVTPKGYFTGEGVIKTDSFGMPPPKGSICIEMGRYKTAYTCRTAIVITYVEMVRMLERHCLESYNLHEMCNLYSKISINTATLPGTKDLIVSAAAQARKITNALCQ